MGCIGIKDKKLEPKNIDYDFSATYTLKIDQFFDDAKDCLKTIEQLRSDIEDSSDNLLKDSYAMYLKSPNMKEALRIMFWCISANHQGNIQQCKPEIQNIPPYLALELGSDTKLEVTTLWRYFTTYLNALKEGPHIIQEELEKYGRFVEEANGFVENGIEDILSVHKTQIEKSQAALNISRNIRKLQEQASNVKRVKDLVEDERKEAEKLIGVIEDLIKTADEVGEKAYQQGLLTPEEVCFHCHPELNKGAVEGEFLRSKLDLKKLLK